MDLATFLKSKNAPVSTHTISHTRTHTHLSTHTNTGTHTLTPRPSSIHTDSAAYEPEGYAANESPASSKPPRLPPPPPDRPSPPPPTCSAPSPPSGTAAQPTRSPLHPRPPQPMQISSLSRSTPLISPSRGGGGPRGGAHGEGADGRTGVSWQPPPHLRSQPPPPRLFERGGSDVREILQPPPHIPDRESPRPSVRLAPSPRTTLSPGFCTGNEAGEIPKNPAPKLTGC